MAALRRIGAGFSSQALTPSLYSVIVEGLANPLGKAGGRRVGKVPLYMDVHRNVEGLTADAVADAHKKDLEVQDEYGVKYHRYWYNEETDRKSTRLNSSHANISYAVFCLKKKKKQLLYGEIII